MGPETEFKPLKVKFNWKAYYYSFVEAHGEPVEFRGKLLFQDGWTYAPDYKGPEVQPPEDLDELRRIQTYYWETRQAILKGLLEQVNRLDRNIVDTQSHHSCTLLLDVEGAEDPIEVTATMYQERADYLKEELNRADGHIHRLTLAPAVGSLNASFNRL